MDVRSRLRGSLTADQRGLLERLYVEVGPRLVAYVRHAYGLHEDAEDIVAETFCRAARNIVALRASQRRDLYLVTAVRNLCRDRFRRVRPRVHGEDALAQQPAGDGPPSHVLAGHEQLADLKDAVLGLPDGLREVVVLRYSAGLKFEEIAELLHVPLGTALSRMHAALERLRRTMGGDYEC